MNIDDFIEATDKDLEVDTSTRCQPGSLTPPGVGSPSRSISAGSGNRKSNGVEGKQAHPQQRQFSPQNLSHQDHPLKANRGPSVNLNVGPRRSATLSQRRSLIQPIVAPKTPDTHSAKCNKSEPSSLTADRVHRQRSGSVASQGSLRAGGEPDISTLLQSLATKELELLDGKHRVEELKKKLAAEETLHQERLKELQELKEQVGIHFHKTAANSMSPTGDKYRSNTKEREELKEPKEPSARASSPAVSSISNEQPAAERRHSLWSKPLAMLGQVDQIIQHEFERSLNWDDPPSPAPQVGDTVRQGKQSDAQTGVSQSIWSFVNDMRSGLLGIDEEVETESLSRPKPEKDHAAKVNSDIKQFKTAGRAEAKAATAEENKLKFFGSGMSEDELVGDARDVEMKEL